jgi:hypothetical protein
MARIDSWSHLLRRFVGSFDRRRLAPSSVSSVAEILTPQEFELWKAMRNEDQRHSLTVARRYRALRPNASRAELAGVLLHDVGKIPSHLGTFLRVVATVVGPLNRRFRQYLDHETIGAEMAHRIRCEQVTIDLIRGEGPPDMARALAEADGY